MIVNNDLYQENVNQTINFEDNNTFPLESINLDHVVSDRSNYNIPFNSLMTIQMLIQQNCVHSASKLCQLNKTNL